MSYSGSVSHQNARGAYCCHVEQDACFVLSFSVEGQGHEWYGLLFRTLWLAMNAIQIKDPATLIEIEDAISLIRSQPGVPIRLPKNSFNKRRGAMHDASRLQMLITWARGAGDALLEFDGQNSVESVLSELGDYAPGIAALRLSKGLMIGNTLVSRRDALFPAAAKMKSSDDGDFGRLIKGRCIDLTCVSGSEVQYLKPLFFARQKEAVKGKAEMQLLARRVINQINQNDSGLIPETLIKAIGIFTHELFLNTQEHATSDFDDSPYHAHVEGLIISWKQLDENQFSKDFMGNQRLLDFWKRELRESGNTAAKNSLRCLEISYFDSGPGYVSRAVGKHSDNLTLEQEDEILKNCLQKNTTSKEQVGAGQGLPNVLAELRDIGGLIRIRSGRKSIFNAFSPGDKDVDLYDFQDWNNAPLSCAVGAVVSILIPLRKS